MRQLEYCDKLAHSVERQVDPMKGVVQQMRDDVAAGFLVSTRELVHAETFADFLAMADHQLEAGYKDPAAVLCSGVLENHLKQLATKHGVGVTEIRSGREVPRDKEQVNISLRQSGVYSALVQQQITANLALRNRAAHAEWGEYTADDVRRFIDWLRDFMIRFPA